MKKIFAAIVFAIYIVVFFCSCSSTPRKRGEEKTKNQPASLRKVKLVNSSGVASTANIDTIFKKGDVIQINGVTYAIN